jgi:hypothetical protein
VQLDAGLIALGQEHFEDVAGFVIAEQLAEFFLVVGHGVFADHADEIPLGVARQCGFAEMRVLREEIARLGVHVGEIAAATARHQDFLAGLVRVVEQQHLTPTPGGGQCTHQPSGASANDHDFGRAQNGVLMVGRYKTNCGSELARESGVSFNVMSTDRLHSRASSLPQGIFVSWKIVYKIRTRSERPLILPSFRRCKACMATVRSTAT